MPDKRILPEKEKTIQKTSGNDIMYAKAIERCQTGSFKNSWLIGRKPVSPGNL